MKKISFIFMILFLTVSCSLPAPQDITPTPVVITATEAMAIMTTPPQPSATDTVLPSPSVTLTSTHTETPTLTPSPGVAMVTPSSVNVNCRYGPSLDYLVTGALIVGESVPITGKTAGGAWWEINNKLAPGQSCWVAASATITSGNLTPVPVKAPPAAKVIEVSITAPETIHGHCGGPNATSFEVSIRTNGPTGVDYHLSIYNGDGTLRNETTTETLSFASADTQTFDPGGAYKTDCGDFYARVIVTSPNNISDQVNWSVVEP